MQPEEKVSIMGLFIVQCSLRNLLTILAQLKSAAAASHFQTRPRLYLCHLWLTLIAKNLSHPSPEGRSNSAFHHRAHDWLGKNVNCFQLFSPQRLTDSERIFIEFLQGEFNNEEILESTKYLFSIGNQVGATNIQDLYLSIY